MKNGQWLDIWKTATITPIPKIYPTPGIEILREISGLFHESKIAEKIVAEFMLSDIKKHMDESQYANRSGTSAQHSLIKMVDQILKATDKHSRGDKLRFS